MRWTTVPICCSRREGSRGACAMVRVLVARDEGGKGCRGGEGWTEVEEEGEEERGGDEQKEMQMPRQRKHLLAE